MIVSVVIDCALVLLTPLVGLQFRFVDPVASRHCMVALKPTSSSGRTTWILPMAGIWFRHLNDKEY